MKINETHRILIALGILFVDLAVFFLPLTAIAVAVIIIFRPPLALEWLKQIYGEK